MQPEVPVLNPRREDERCQNLIELAKQKQAELEKKLCSQHMSKEAYDMAFGARQEVEKLVKGMESYYRSTFHT